jgi:hypothetical protein
MKRVGPRFGLALLAALAIAGGVALALSPPIPQPAAYHAFADARALGGIPNAWNVLSNVPFAIVGWLGLAFLARGPKRAVDPKPRAGAHTAFISYRERPAYVLFFAGVLLTAFGSAFYHLAPSTPRLFWDRLPMSVAFMALFATVIAERVDVYWSRALLLPLVFGGIASVVVWKLSEDRGAGDLRPYVFVQALPMIALPLLMFLCPARYTRSKELALVVVLYAAAKALEHFDARVWEALDHRVSGHSLKHVVAACACWAVLDMLKRRSPAVPDEDRVSEPAVE